MCRRSERCPRMPPRLRQRRKQQVLQTRSTRIAIVGAGSSFGFRISYELIHDVELISCCSPDEDKTSGEDVSFLQLLLKIRDKDVLQQYPAVEPLPYDVKLVVEQFLDLFAANDLCSLARDRAGGTNLSTVFQRN